jgi:Zn-dependent peptidase ImmA (M78 family)
LIAQGEKPLPFVGDGSTKDPPDKTAENIRRTLGIGPNLTTSADKWEIAFKNTIEAVEAAGILFMRAGYAFGYTGHKLSVDEFRGFAIADEYAPLVFINGSDAPNAQMFTLAHEIAHIWLGISGVSNLNKTYANGSNSESYCNNVAAEVLLPLEEMRASWHTNRDYNDEIYRLSKKYKVSNIVVARRAHDAGFISKERYSSIFSREFSRKKTSSGGDYYLNEQYQNSKRFSVAVLTEAKSGRTLFHDAIKLLAIRKQETFAKYMQSLQMEAI